MSPSSMKHLSNQTKLALKSTILDL